MIRVAGDLPVRRQVSGFDGQGLVGRDQLLSVLAGKLRESSGEVALTAADRALTMHGGGGIGKTALAIEYCHTLASSEGYDLVWWVNADSDQTTSTSLVSLIEKLGGDTENLHLRSEADRVLTGAGRWLAVFDNVHDRNSFDRWRPQATGGSVLITTRSNAKWGEGRSIPVDTIADQDAKEWLVRSAGNPTDPGELAASDELVTALGGLPLALTMATAFIGNTPVKLSKYLKLFEESPVRLLDDPDVDVDNYDKTVYTALAVTRDQLSEANQSAALLMLEYASFFAPDDIPMRLFTPEGLGVSSETDVLNAKRALQQRSLITPQGDDAFSVHRLVQSVTRYHLDNPLSEHPIQQGPVHAIDSVSSPRSVVIVAANSTDAPMNLGEELRSIQLGLELTDKLEAKISHASRPDDLISYVSDEEPVIVHFSGHGNREGIALKEDDGLQDRPVSGERLERFFAGRGVRLVVLNSCYSDSQAAAIQKSVEAVIGTPTDLDDEAAHRFSRAFYRKLARGGTVSAALKDGQDAVDIYGLDDQFSGIGDLDIVLTNGTPPATKPPNVTKQPDTLNQPGTLNQPATVNESPSSNSSPLVPETSSWLLNGYYAAGIVVAVVAVITLAIALWPKGPDQQPNDPTGPSTSTPAVVSTTAP